MRQGHVIILFSHGSRDPSWRSPMEAVAACIRARHPERQVMCAYLELCAPSLADAASQLIAQGAVQLTVVPMFLGSGRHVREDLPSLMQALRLAHPGVPFHMQEAIGEDPRMTALMAQIACETPLDQ